MNLFLESHKAFLKYLLHNDVDFLLVGGYAVIYHGYARMTNDMDIWINPNHKNKDKFISALRAYGIEEADLAHLSSLDFNQALAFHIGESHDKIDFLTKMVGLKFEEAAQRMEQLKVDDISVNIIHIEDLIINKMLSNRMKDKADVEELQKIMQLKKEL